MMSPKKLMPEESTNINDDQAVIQAHQNYLKRLQEAFDKKCNDISETAKEKLANVPETDPVARQEIMKEEQAELDKVLSELKQAVNQKSSEARQKLETIENQRNEKALNLDQELAQL